VSTSPDARLRFPATARNREPILEVLRRVLPREGVVLEIASGSGEHAVFFARHLPALTWAPTDAEPEHLASIDAWRATEALANVAPARSLDVHAPWPVVQADAVFCANLIHIAPWSACLALLEGAAHVLPSGGRLVLYGPFRIGGVHTAPSNEAFDASLRARDPRWGVRDLDEVVACAAERGLVLRETVPMPANNLTVVLERR
jgi:SAM-dependent methyltransferase